MTDYESRGRGGRGHNNRKRRFRDDDDFDHRPQRRRYEEPLPVKIRKQLLSIAESPLNRTEEDVKSIAKTIAEHYEDEELRSNFVDLALQLIVEQPFKIPFIAAIVLTCNAQKPEIATELLPRAADLASEHIEAGSWREVKLVLRFLACLEGIFEGEGMLPLLDELFSRAVELQTASDEDALGLELVKIILLTIPYVLSSSATHLEKEASSLLEKTDIIASTPHTLEARVNPYPGSGSLDAREPASIISLLQKQLQAESNQGWELACIPRPWKTQPEDGVDPLASATKHPFPPIIIPDTLNPGQKLLFPELFFSVYADQDVETVPPTTNIASSLLRDSLIDTINILNFNRNAVARFLIDVDCYFSPHTFVKRATQFDRLKEVAGDRSTWKPEDVVVDAVFSQLFQLPMPEHKLVYYHSVLTETCKVAPAAIAPSLGRAIRYLYKHVDAMDMELEYRFMDWFAHHLSNFGFTWKWTEWVEDVELADLHPKKAFMSGALEKEVRLSFANRIRQTLPAPYQVFIPESKDNEVPEFKYNNAATPFADEGKQIMTLLRKKAPKEEVDAEIELVLNAIQEKAATAGIADPLLPSTDAFVTSICYIGSKSLSHVLSRIEYCKDRLLALGPSSPAARRQIITSVMEYWKDQPGVGVNIIDKLLNYTILTPMSVIEWVLVEHKDNGAILAQSHIYEMVSTTVFKVTNRIRQIVATRDQPGLQPEQVKMLQDTLDRERADQTNMFGVIEEALLAFATGSNEEVTDAEDGTEKDKGMVRSWAQRWLTVFRRKLAVEEAVVGEHTAAPVQALENGS